MTRGRAPAAARGGCERVVAGDAPWTVGADDPGARRPGHGLRDLLRGLDHEAVVRLGVLPAGLRHPGSSPRSCCSARSRSPWPSSWAGTCGWRTACGPPRRTGQSAVLDRYRDLLEANIWLAILVPSAFLGLVAGASAVGQSLGTWRGGTGCRHHRPTSGSMRASTSSSTRSGRTCYSCSGRSSSRSSPPRPCTSPSAGSPRSGRAARSNGARVHLSVLMRAAAGGLRPAEPARPVRLPAPAGHALFTGMQYTDDHSRLTAKLVMAVISFLMAAVLFANGFLRRWTVAALAGADGRLRADPRTDLPAGRPELPGQAQRARAGGSLHLEPHRRDPDGLRHRQDRGRAVPRSPRCVPARAKQDAETLLRHPADRPGGGGADLREPAAGARLVHLPPRCWTSTGTSSTAPRPTPWWPPARSTARSCPTRTGTTSPFTHGYGLVAAYGNRRRLLGDPVWIEKKPAARGRPRVRGTHLLRREHHGLRDRRTRSPASRRSSSTPRTRTRPPTPIPAPAACRWVTGSPGCCTRRTSWT